jgi:hypothetical protein
MPVAWSHIDSSTLFQISDRSFFRVTQSQSLTVVHLDTELQVTATLANFTEILENDQHQHADQQMLLRHVDSRWSRLLPML